MQVRYWIRESQVRTVEHRKLVGSRMKLLIERSKTDAEGEGAVIAIPRRQFPETCPVTAVQQWLTVAEISEGPIFRKVNRGGVVAATRLVPDAVRQILLKRAAKAGLTGCGPTSRSSAAYGSSP